MKIPSTLIHLLLTSLSAAAVNALRSVPDLYKPQFVGPSPMWYSDTMVEHAGHLIRTFHALSGKELVPLKLLDDDPAEAAKALFFLPDRVVVSHGTQEGPEGPVLNYGNSAALKRWSASWEQLTSMPSKYTAEPMEQSARQAFLDTVTKNDIVENYSGVRVTTEGKRFLLINGSVWNVKPKEFDGLRIGQAATFNAWEDL
jgi:MEKHLA domain